MKKWRMLIAVLLFAFFTIQIYSQTNNSKTTDQEELELILNKCAEYCEKLSNSALHFVCKETIEEDLYHGLSGGPSVSISGGTISARGGSQ